MDIVSPNIGHSMRSRDILMGGETVQASKTRCIFDKSRFMIACLIFLIGTALMAQVGGIGGIAGTITDPSGGRVPDAKIIIKSVETGVADTIASDNDGKYTLPSLAVGGYTLTVQKEGFQQVTQTGIQVNVGPNTIVDVVLTVGNVSQQVQVSATVPVVETQDSAIGMIVGHEEVQDLPLNGRSYIQMATYAPGVISIPSNTVGGFGEGAPTRLAINGARPEGQLFLVDGTDTKGLWGSSSGSQLAGTTLGIDAISEFQVLTNTFGAQYAGNGTVINAAIRTGTNSFHGTVFDFERNSALDARNYFDPLTGPPPFYRHQFGGSTGGPVKKDKVFFFANYEGLRQNQGVSNAPIQVPDANARMGLIPCYQAIGITSQSGGPCTATSGGLANMAKVFPAEFAIIQPVLLTWPVANGVELTGPATSCSAPPCASGAANYEVPLQQPTTEDYFVAKGDYNISASDSVQLTYILDRSYLVQPNYVSTLDTINNQLSNQVTLTEKKIISTTKINTAHFSYFRPDITSVPSSTPALNVGLPDQRGSWSIVGGIWSSLASGGSILSYLSNWEASDQLYWTTGRHSIQLGGDISRHQWNITFPGVQAGTWSFPNMLSFFKNIPVTFSGTPPSASDGERGFRYTGIAPYFQDQYQVISRLSINLGVRYDFASNPIEAQNKLTTILNPRTSSSFTPISHFYYKNPTVPDIAPRVGFAWDVFGNHKTSVRGGIGLFYDGYIPQYFGQDTENAPFYESQTVANPPFPNPFSGGGILEGLINAGATAYGNPGTYHNRNPYLMQVNLNVQQQLFASTVFSVGYIETEGRHLYLRSPDDTCTPTSIAPNGYYIRDYTASQASSGTCPMMNPNFAGVSLITPSGNSNFNSLQASLTRSFHGGLEWQASYTWSRCLSFGDAFTGGETVNIGSRGGSSGGTYPGVAVSSLGNQDYGPCDFNLSQVFSSNALYALPFHGNRFREGWQTSLVGTAHSGFLTTPVVGVDTANCGFNLCAAIVRPNVVPGCDRYRGAETISEWYDPQCFSEPVLGTFGDSSRNTIKGPGFVNFDYSLVKDTRVSESTKLEIRAEFFNVLNHTNWGFPTYSLFLDTNGTRNPVAGQIQDTAGYTSRQIQFAAKFMF
jgi:hypothetical protein